MKRGGVQSNKKQEKSEASDEGVNVDGMDDLFEGFGNLEISPSVPVTTTHDHFFFAPKMQFDTEPLPDIPDEDVDEMEKENVASNKKKPNEIGKKPNNRPIGIGIRKNKTKSKTKGPKFTERSRKNRIREYDPDSKTASRDREGSFALSEAPQSKKRVVYERSLKIQVGDDEYEWVSCSTSDSGEEEPEKDEPEKQDKDDNESKNT
jgi:hypothetical protein